MTDINILIKTINGLYDFEIKSGQLLRESSDNEVFILDSVDGANKYIARVSKRQIKQDILFEAEWIKELHNKGVPVASVIGTKQNSVFFELPNSSNSVVVFEFISGEHVHIDCEHKPPMWSIKSGSETLALLHNIYNKKELLLSRNRTIYSELERVLSHRKDFEKTIPGGQGFLQEVDKFVDWGKKYPFTPVLVHNDYRIGNLIFKDNCVATVIDFDWCCYGPAIKDVALALAEWSFPDGAKEHWVGVFNEFIKSYNHIVIEKIALNSNLYKWIAFSCLSDTATYLVDRLEKGEIKPVNYSYMYAKFIYFAKRIS